MSVVYFLLLVAALVLIHELGHFVAARSVGVRVLRFSLGFGRPVARVLRGGTEYQIGILPIGGYVRLLGESPEEQVPAGEEARAFRSRPTWQRLLIVCAGPAANLLLATLIYAALFASHTALPAAVIGDVIAGSPAQTAGLKPGDTVVAVDGEPIRYWYELEEAIQGSPGQELQLDLQRDVRQLSRYVTPLEFTHRNRTGERTQQALLGIARDPIAAKVGVLDVSSPAGRAGLRTGDVVINVNGRDVGSWTELESTLRGVQRANLAYVRPIPVPGFPEVTTLSPQVATVVADTRVTRRGQIELDHGLLPAQMFVARVDADSPASRAGLRAGDLIEAVDGEPVVSWLDLDQRLQRDPERAWQISWRRATAEGVTRGSSTVRQAFQTGLDEFGRERETLTFGAHSDLIRGAGVTIPVDARVRYAISRATTRSIETVGEISGAIGALIRGQLPSSHLGGPITLFRAASASGSDGWEAFFLLLALMSVTVGLLNLLPIPVLDGGQIVLLLVERLRGRPLPNRIRDRMTVIGISLVAVITMIAIKNDLLLYLF